MSYEYIRKTATPEEKAGMVLRHLAETLENAHRQGRPGPVEGSVVITITDELAQIWASQIRHVADNHFPEEA